MLVSYRVVDAKSNHWYPSANGGMVTCCLAVSQSWASYLISSERRDLEKSADKIFLNSFKQITIFKHFQAKYLNFMILHMAIFHITQNYHASICRGIIEVWFGTNNSTMDSDTSDLWTICWIGLVISLSSKMMMGSRRKNKRAMAL